MVLEKGRERVPVWASFVPHADKVSGVVTRILTLQNARELSVTEKTLVVQFLIVAFAGLEVDAVRQVRLTLSMSRVYPFGTSGHCVCARVPPVPPPLPAERAAPCGPACVEECPARPCGVGAAQVPWCAATLGAFE